MNSSVGMTVSVLLAISQASACDVLTISVPPPPDRNIPFEKNDSAFVGTINQVRYTDECGLMQRAWDWLNGTDSRFRFGAQPAASLGVNVDRNLLGSGVSSRTVSLPGGCLAYRPHIGDRVIAILRPKSGITLVPATEVSTFSAWETRLAVSSRAAEQ